MGGVGDLLGGLGGDVARAVEGEPFAVRDGFRVLDCWHDAQRQACFHFYFAAVSIGRGMTGVGKGHRAIGVESRAATGDKSATTAAEEPGVQRRKNCRRGRRFLVSHNPYRHGNEHGRLESFAAYIADEHDSSAFGRLENLIEVPTYFRSRKIDSIYPIAG